MIFLSGSQYFTLILFKKNDTQDLSPIWFISFSGRASVSETGCSPIRGILFQEGAVCLQQCSVLLLNLNIYLIFSWQQWNSTKSESSFREMLKKIFNPNPTHCLSTPHPSPLPPKQCKSALLLFIVLISVY